MKKFSFLALAAAGMLFAACSSDKDVVANEVNGGVASYENGYISVGINLPTVPQSVTRATNDNGYPNNNFDLDDGDDNEYAVGSVYLLTFRPSGSGADENNATFQTAFLLTTEWAKNSDPQVTVSTRENIVKKIGSKVQKGDLALVVINPNSLLTFAPKTGDGVVEGEQTVKVGIETDAFSGTFGAFRAKLATSDNLDATEMHKTTTTFYMTNAPLYAAQGSSTTAPTTTVNPAYRVLVPIENVYETEQAAKDGVASEIFVERGMAKVTLNATPANATLGTKVTETGVADADVTFAITGWTLDQTNASSYLVRSTEGYSDFIKLVNGASKVYRFTGNTAILPQNNPGDYKYRGYFAKDPNYDADVAAGDLIYFKNMTGGTFTTPTGTGEFAPKYCFENTFDVQRQTRKNTTLAQVEITVAGGADLYTVNGVTSKIYKLSGVQTAIKNVVLEYCKANNLMAVGKDLSGKTSDDLFNNAAITAKTDPEYEYTVTAITVKDNTYFKTGIDTELANAATLTAINSQLGVITKYTGGKSYYAIRIKHFGDELTPWHVGTNNSGKSSLDSSVDWIWSTETGAKEAEQPSAGNSYPNNNANDYLGRYGVLRNNWYDLKIGSIKTLGSPVPLDYSADGTPDDELEGYINVKINIMSWAKRTQQWNF